MSSYIDYSWWYFDKFLLQIQSVDSIQEKHAVIQLVGHGEFKASLNVLSSEFSSLF